MLRGLWLWIRHPFLNIKVRYGERMFLAGWKRGYKCGYKDGRKTREVNSQ